MRFNDLEHQKNMHAEYSRILIREVENRQHYVWELTIKYLAEKMGD